MAANGTVGDYRIRIVYDPVRIWSGNEREQGDLPHDDTTWATVAIDGGTAEIGVYHYYDDHDWFAVELEEDETYRDSRVGIRHLGHDTRYRHRSEALRLFGQRVSIDYANAINGTAIIDYDVPTGEGGTYYIDVSYANFQDDARCS